MVCFGSLVMGGARMLDSLFSAGQQMIPFLQVGNVCRNSNVQKQHRAIDVFDAVLLLVKPVLERSIYNVKGAGPWITCFSRRFHHRFFHLHKILRDFSWTVWVSVDLGSLLFAAYFSASHASPAESHCEWECAGGRCVQKKSKRDEEDNYDDSKTK